MVIIKVSEIPYKKYKVKNIPKDAKYECQSVNGNEVYYSKSKNAYYEIKK